MVENDVCLFGFVFFLYLQVFRNSFSNCQFGWFATAACLRVIEIF